MVHTSRLSQLERLRASIFNTTTDARSAWTICYGFLGSASTAALSVLWSQQWGRTSASERAAEPGARPWGRRAWWPRCRVWRWTPGSWARWRERCRGWGWAPVPTPANPDAEVYDTDFNYEAPDVSAEYYALESRDFSGSETVTASYLRSDCWSS